MDTSLLRGSVNIHHYSSPLRWIIAYYYTTQAVAGPITKINQSKCSIAGPIFSKYRTGHRPEWSRACVFAVFAFFSRVINLLLTKLARDRSGRISVLGLFCTDRAALGPYCQDLGPIFSQYGPRAWLIRYIYNPPIEFHITFKPLVNMVKKANGDLMANARDWCKQASTLDWSNWSCVHTNLTELRFNLSYSIRFYSIVVLFTSAKIQII